MEIRTKTPGTGEMLKKFGLPALLMAMVLGALFYTNLTYCRQQPGGTDFLYRWLPTRLVVVEGYPNPYSPEVEYQVELMHFGHAHQGTETPGIFAYPYYIIPFYIPFALIKDFTLARAAWMTLLVLVQMALVIIPLRLFKIRLKNLTIAILLVFSLFFSYFTQPLIDGNPSPIAALFALLCLAAISKNHDWLAGALLALATIKPQLAVLFFALVWFWAFSNRRYTIILSSFIGLAVLMGVSFAIQPTWFAEFLKDVLIYPEIASPHSPGTILSVWLPEYGRWIGLGLNLVVMLIIGREWLRTWKKGFIALFWAACLTFTLQPLSGVTSAKSNFIAMVPGIVLMTAALNSRCQVARLHVAGWNINILIGFSIIISWVLNYIGRTVVIGEVRLFFVDFLIAPVVLAAGLYWMRKEMLALDIPTA